MSLKSLFLCISTAFLLCSCGNLAQKQNTAISSGVYATQDAIKAGRFDLAKKYNDETSRLVPPPTKKQRIVVKPFKPDTVKTVKDSISPTSSSTPFPYVILPEGFDNSHVLVENSPEYNQLLDQNKNLKKQVDQEKETFQKYKEKNDEIIRLKDEELQKLRNKPGFFRTIWNLVTGFFKWGPLGFGIIAIVLVVIALIVPELAPFIWAFFRAIGAIFSGILGLLKRAMYWLIEKFSKK